MVQKSVSVVRLSGATSSLSFNVSPSQLVSWRSFQQYLTIIPRAQMGPESIAHEAEGRMGYWLRGHEGERNNCFSKIQLVGKKYRDKTTLAS